MGSALSSLFGLALAIPAPGECTVPEIVAEYRRLTEHEVWPGFDPSGIPLLIFDGQETWLVDHPRAPAEFEAIEGEAELRRMDGHHEAVRANTSIEFAGVPTATFLMDGDDLARPAPELASVLVHEAFHVYQRAHHPSWGANELELLRYPVTNGELLFQRRVETECLRRAVEATHETLARGWAAAACRARRERFAKLPEALRAYERGNELNEGLAYFVQYRALGSRGPKPPLPAEEYAAEDVRLRAYGVGEAWASLLERFVDGWSVELEEERVRSLDQRLEEALAGSQPLELSDSELASMRARATADAARVAVERARRRAEFEDREGWSIEVVCAEERPLSLKNFDPWNTKPIDERLVLHTRWIVLENGADRLEVLDAAALTEGAGEDPLSGGVARVLVTGLAEEPRVEDVAGKLKVSAAGFSGEWQKARLARDGQRLRISPE